VILLVMASVLVHPHPNEPAESILSDTPRSAPYAAPAELADPLHEYRTGLFLASVWELNGPYRHPPPTTATKAPASRSYGSGVEQWRSLVAASFGSEVDTALRVMRCESNGNPSAQNRRSSAAGLFQILQKTWQAFSPYPWADRYHPRANVETAKRIRDGQGWPAWTCY
jgi:soluble lytic murein transglycosylase-like protein